MSNTETTPAAITPATLALETARSMLTHHRPAPWRMPVPNLPHPEEFAIAFPAE